MHDALPLSTPSSPFPSLPFFLPSISLSLPLGKPVYSPTTERLVLHLELKSHLC